jgi:4'-phosphopantetheinyl transferase
MGMPVVTISERAAAPTRRSLVRLRLDEESAHFDRLWRLLSEAERRRALRFARKADMRRFVIGRGRLRELLAPHIGQSPADLRFRANAFGKPLLDVTGPAPHFNLSHSGDWILVAIDEQAPVGVDVECVREEMAQIEQFHRVLSTEEQCWLAAQPASLRALAFARTWVRKEAYVKALGAGMSCNLESIAIVDGPGAGPRLLYDRNDVAPDTRWSFVDLTLDGRHVGCLVHRLDG